MGDVPVSVFQAWWATHVSVPETSMRYGPHWVSVFRAPCPAFRSPMVPAGRVAGVSGAHLGG